MNSKTLFSVSPITIFIILLSLLYNRFHFLFINYFLTFIHELSHVLVASIFKVNVESIKFHPFGFYAKIDNLENEHPLIQIAILVAGPLSYFISLGLIGIAFKYGLVSSYGYKYANESNLIICLFNLIPFFPLDGGRILEVLFSFCFEDKIVRKLRIFVSFISFLILSFYLTMAKQYLLIAVMLISLISLLVFYKKEQIKFLLTRLAKNNHQTIKINKKEKIYRYKDNFLLENATLYNEKYIIKRLLKKVRQK